MCIALLLTAIRYILSNCQAKAKHRILQCAASSDLQSLLRPMMIDTFLVDAASETLKVDLQRARGELLRYVS